jgi:hypothetical protein
VLRGQPPAAADADASTAARDAAPTRPPRPPARPWPPQNGSFWKQFTAILLLRLTPVVPYSASNYVLGLTPVSMPAYVGGTFVGVSIWAFVYASLGGASRKLLERGVKMDVLFADLAERSSRCAAARCAAAPRAAPGRGWLAGWRLQPVVGCSVAPMLPAAW